MKHENAEVVWPTVHSSQHYDIIFDLVTWKSGVEKHFCVIIFGLVAWKSGATEKKIVSKYKFT